MAESRRMQALRGGAVRSGVCSVLDFTCTARATHRDSARSTDWAGRRALRPDARCARRYRPVRSPELAGAWCVDREHERAWRGPLSFARRRRLGAASLSSWWIRRALDRGQLHLFRRRAHAQLSRAAIARVAVRARAARPATRRRAIPALRTALHG